MKIFKLIIVLLIVAQAISSYAQKNVEFDKSNFPNNKKELKNAIKNMEQADEIISQYRPNYKYAISFYNKANSFNSSNSVLNYKLGYCNLRIGKTKEAIEFLEKSKKLGSYPDSLLFTLAEAYHINYEFDKAIKYFTDFKNSLNPNQAEVYDARINKEIKECETGKELVNNPVRVFIDNIGPKINSKFAEYGPKVNADESELYFTSRRSEDGKFNAESLSLYMEDIYKSTKKDGKWQSPQKLSDNVNSDYHDAIIGLSPDGQKLIVFKGDNGGDIYLSELDGDEWSNPDGISRKINSSFHESSGTFSYDYLTFYFVSDIDGGLGKHDIYFSKKNEKGKWEDAQNIGSVVNTKNDEIGIFALPDGKTFYFSSNGHNTMGGYDIFKTTNVNGQWSTPENLGYPINTTGDDLFFTLGASGKHGYYSSSLNKDSYGSHDIYLITFRGEKMPVINNNEDNLLAISNAASKLEVIDKKVEIKTTNVTLLKGTITDEFTGEPLYAEIELTDLSSNKVIATFKSNKSSGKYLVTLPSGKNYGIAVKAENCIFHSENINIQDANTQYQEIEKDIQLKRIEVGSKVVLKNVFFDTGKSTLRDESKTELNNLLKLMNEVPTLKIEISGHTDNVGSNSSNQKLSQDRAKAVVDYLIENGISSDRLTYKGYGEEQPVADNSTEEGRQKNRRTEFEVLSR